MNPELDALHLITHFGGVEKLRRKKIAMTWAYSPSYGKPLSVPQGVVGLMTRSGMDVTLAHPEGYEIMPEVEVVARRNAEAGGGSFTRTDSMDDAFEDADVVYPESWAPFAALEKKLLAQNADHAGWEGSEARLATTRDGSALSMHCLPADISGVSCTRGEVAASLFERYRVPLYKEASFKSYVIAAMILLSRFEDSPRVIRSLLGRSTPRAYAP